MAWYDHLEYGDPVVCVDACWSTSPAPLTLGRVYRFKNVKQASFIGVYRGVERLKPIQMHLIGVPHPTSSDAGYALERFRPATSTDLPASIREALKTPAPKEKV